MKKSKRFSKNLARVVLLLNFLFFLPSCTLQKEPYDRTRVERKIVTGLKRGQDLDSLTHIEGNTLYIYAAVKEPILEIQPIPTIPGQGDAEREPLTFSFVDSTYEENKFKLLYEIQTSDEDQVAGRKFFKNITSNYSAYAQEIMSNIYLSLREVLTDSLEKFNFFVIYIADISRGIAMKTTINERDLKKYFTGLLPDFEFYKRVVIGVQGDKAIIDDSQAKHMEYKDIILGDFINELFVYTLSRGLPPPTQAAESPPTPVEQIVKLFDKITSNYDFTTYRSLCLRDMATEEETCLSSGQIKEMFNGQ